MEGAQRLPGVVLGGRQEGRLRKVGVAGTGCPVKELYGAGQKDL